MLKCVVEANSRVMAGRDLLNVALNVLLGSASVLDKSASIDKKLAYFKLLFKKCYGLEYERFGATFVSYEDFIRPCLLNSFASLLDHVDFAVYQDVKVLLEF